MSLVFVIFSSQSVTICRGRSFCIIRSNDGIGPAQFAPRLYRVVTAEKYVITSRVVRDRSGILREMSSVANPGIRKTKMNRPKNTVCVWYDREAEAAAKFYASVFPNSKVTAVHRAPSDYPSGKEGDVITVEFTVLGIPCIGLNGGPAFKHSGAFSFQVATIDQEETDRYWNAIVENGGQENACGWCQDRWGISWQISPLALLNAVTGTDTAAAKRAFEAMMPMRKIDIATIEAAVRGEIRES